MDNKILNVMTVFGTRPEAIKMAPLIKELKSRRNICCKVCVTGQHREMLDQVLKIFQIIPDYDLNIMEKNQTLAEITAKGITKLDAVLKKERPDIVLVHGDTSTTFASALSAFYNHIKTGHVEAGLRTYDKYTPFPEEMNRCLVGRIADLHFAPVRQNAENLKREDIQGSIYITGNTAIDALSQTISTDYKFENPVLAGLDFADGTKNILVTAHRRENYGIAMENIMQSFREIAGAHPDVRIIYPLHLSPVVQEAGHRNLDGVRGIVLTEPLSVSDMHNLMARSYMIMTDSGGLQEEAPAIGKPVVLLRENTERPEAVAAGGVKIGGTSLEGIVSAANAILTQKEVYEQMSSSASPYGDGKASQRITDALLYEFGLSDVKPDNFGC